MGIGRSTVCITGQPLPHLLASYQVSDASGPVGRECAESHFRCTWITRHVPTPMNQHVVTPDARPRRLCPTR